MERRVQGGLFQRRNKFAQPQLGQGACIPLRARDRARLQSAQGESGRAVQNRRGDPKLQRGCARCAMPTATVARRL